MLRRTWGDIEVFVKADHENRTSPRSNIIASYRFGDGDSLEERLERAAMVEKAE
jgi:hypothetical protein